MVVGGLSEGCARWGISEPGGTPSDFVPQDERGRQQPSDTDLPPALGPLLELV